MCGMLRNAAKFMTRKSKFLFYNSYVYPHLIYCAIYLNGARKKDIQILQRAQNRSLKLLYFYPRLTSENIIYNELKILTINSIIEHESCKVIWKIFQGKLLCSLNLKTNADFHSYNTRRRENIHLNQTNSFSGKSKISHSAVKYFNELPEELRKIDVREIFKKELKMHLLEKYLSESTSSQSF